MRITSAEIKGFRSLESIEINKLSEVNIFHGENNSGKSNILLALEYLFCPKWETKTFQTRQSPDQEEVSVKTRFHEGQIQNFKNNFFRNSTNKISYEIELCLNKTEINTILKVGDETKKLIRNTPDNNFALSLELARETDDAANMKLKKIVWGKRVVYEWKGNQRMIFDVQTGEGLEFINNLIDLINDKCFILINSKRFMERENDEQLEDELFFTPGNFKRSLFNLHTSEDERKQKIFNEISDVFEKIFEYGKLSFSRKGNHDELDVRLEKDGFYLPIEHMGTGVQQLLILVSNILYHKKSVIAIEELELNLSPRNQKAILIQIEKMIAEKDYLEQILITSHSEHLCEGENYFFVTLVDSKTNVNYVASKKEDPISKEYFEPKMKGLKKIYANDKRLSRHKY